ncbi:MAG: 16S rRNA (uracil(1498)-N(3))-methyltransferase [Muribaculaceae bacterium]|nr:16S rRNA (uracil(1498)-N(3))-methyltransferase [Muribaculaceae bacterium]
MIQFYAPDIETSLTLPESDSQHCVRVLRMKPGDIVDVIDGKGYRYACRLIDAHPKHANVEIIERQHIPLSWGNNITVAVAPTKHLDRMEWMVEKLTEIGVNRIIPLLCRYSERKEIKVERLEKIAISAMKQSLKTTLPVIFPMTPFKDIVTNDNSVQKFIAYCDKTIPRKLLSKEYAAHRDTTILIGPEGDFSIEEIRLALDNGYTPITLGDNRLRTETAAITACDTCHIVNQLNTTISC